MCCTRKFVGFVLLLAVVCEGFLIWWMKERAPVGLIWWEETSDASPYYSQGVPDPPYNLDLESKEMINQAVTKSGALSKAKTDFDKIVALRNWTRQSCPVLDREQPSNRPADILKRFQSGGGGVCGSLGFLYCGALLANGYRARVDMLLRRADDITKWGEGAPDTHVEVEVYSPDHDKWIVMDPTFNCWFHRPGEMVPLSAREIQEIVNNPNIDISHTGRISMERSGAIVPEYDGFSSLPTTETYFIDPIETFRNVFLLYYNVFEPPAKDPIQKYTRNIGGRLLRTAKVIWLLPEGRNKDYIVAFEYAADWLPIGILLLIVMALIPAGPVKKHYEEDVEDEEEDDNEEEEDTDEYE
jgi:hypothetical protein